ncbi:PREDICTED: stAR-related lipid transfer protein 7, mitochondrial [Rhagoletis zephyria]|uniref:stAR-related lipid transfer protein 7, mitochondrial n=1 Tax=Rhagoletis zephyria TaxID=28612 RepID=UPI0008116E63|nr:PREDICTED: stAR-related lipid transfer protein 7, mitochondrial [Rhagoletis zephyria]XP_036320972.1 stAR-related lipid transfer protein 7, mitochondrial [Rhagoletis pomonella]
MFTRIILNIKHRSNVTLRSWSYQFESIVAQRSRRIQQLFSFYHRVYGSNGLQRLLRSYHKQLEPPLRGIMLSAVGVVGLNITTAIEAAGFNWDKERLSLKNFDLCRRDIDFLNQLPNNELCLLCKEKHMKYCYCSVGNKKCRSEKDGGESIRNCRRSLNLTEDPAPLGRKVIESADENLWEPYFSKDEFSIWRREERSAMYSYKVYARFDDVSAEDLLHVQTDLNYRRVWDETAVQLELIEEDPRPNTNSHLIYWEMQWPRLFSNRDYVYCRRFVTDDKRNVMMVASRGTQHPKYPVFSGKVRVNDYWSLMVIKPYKTFSEPGVHYILTYYDDPGLPIPQNIKSWVTQKQMPEFLRKMYLATKQYSFKRALEMQHIFSMSNFHLQNHEYMANESRTSWFKRILRTRDPGTGK